MPTPNRIIIIQPKDYTETKIEIGNDDTRELGLRFSDGTEAYAHIQYDARGIYTTADITLTKPNEGPCEVQLEQRYDGLSFYQGGNSRNFNIEDLAYLRVFEEDYHIHIPTQSPQENVDSTIVLCPKDDESYTVIRAYGPHISIPAFAEDGKPITEIAEKAACMFYNTSDPYEYTSNHNMENIHHHSLPETIDLGASVEKVGAYAFACQTNLETVTAHPGLTEIEQYAFANCSHLNSCDLSQTSLTHIESCAFYKCDLRELELPPSIEWVGRAAFSRNDRLDLITLPEQPEAITPIERSVQLSEAFDRCDVEKIRVVSSKVEADSGDLSKAKDASFELE